MYSSYSDYFATCSVRSTIDVCTRMCAHVICMDILVYCIIAHKHSTHCTLWTLIGFHTFPVYSVNQFTKRTIISLYPTSNFQNIWKVNYILICNVLTDLQ